MTDYEMMTLFMELMALLISSGGALIALLAYIEKKK